MKFGFHVGQVVTFEIEGEKIAGRIAEIGFRFLRFVSEAGKAFRVTVIGDAAAVLVTAE